MNSVSLINCHALTGVPARITLEPVDIVIRDRRIAEVRPTGAQQPEGVVIDGTGCLATPGMINGHNHSHENFQRAVTRICPWRCG